MRMCTPAGTPGAVLALEEIHVPTIRSLLIAIADEDVAVSAPLGDFLRWRGHRVVQATSGAELTLLAEQLLPDVVVQELVFLDANGGEIVQRLKRSSATSRIPVVVLSKWATRELHGSEAADVLLQKPVSVTALVAVIEHLGRCGDCRRSEWSAMAPQSPQGTVPRHPPASA
jgi:DNA-binding response OmpR family regulator